MSTRFTSRNGTVVDTSGPSWSIGGNVTLHFREFHVCAGCAGLDPVRDAFDAYMRAVVSNYRPNSARSAFLRIRRALRQRSIRDAITATDDSFLIAVLDHLRRLKRGSQATIFSSIRDWYVFSTDAGFTGFNADVATTLEKAKMPSSGKGIAILRRDPQSGPLSIAESHRLGTALWKAADEGSLPTAWILSGLLLHHFGFSPDHLRLLHEEDLRRETDHPPARVLKVPRIKKGAPQDRAAFFRRDLSPRLAAVFERLIDENAGEPARTGGPLFRSYPGVRPAPGEYVSTVYFGRICRRLVKQLRLVGDDGQPLNLHPRRLRYTFATRLIEAGASEGEVMEALDHRTPAHVAVYFKARLSIVSQLDRALGAQLAPFAAIALGQAPRPLYEEPFDLPSLETAPIVCPTCRKFRPVEPGPIRQTIRALSDGIADTELAKIIESSRRALVAIGANT